MLIKPSIDNLLDKVENKYELVILASQRGRQIRLRENDKKNDEKFGAKSAIDKLKEVSVALKEIDDDLVESYYKNNEEQIEDILNDKINEEIALLYQTEMQQSKSGEQPE